MSNPNSSEAGLPSTGAVLGFMVDCLGVAKDTEEYSNKEIERLRKGGLGTDKYWEVARKVMDAVVTSFVEAKTARQTINTVFKQKFAAPVRRVVWQMHKGLLVPVPEFGAPTEAVHWKRNAQGELESFGEVLVHDWTEFLFRHEFLVSKCGSSDAPNSEAIVKWATLFAIPFLAQNLIAYQVNDSSFEKGMPRGEFWYLPQLIPRKEADEKFRYKWPVNTVLEWWEDLLGSELTSYSSLLCAPGDDPDNARRQVYAWRHENRPPDQATIDRWCKVSWADKYAGVFMDDDSLPLNERWSRCRDFLVRKGFHDPTHNWLTSLHESVRQRFTDQYRGERLELEILPFKQVPFAAFFNSSDPIAERLPVSELIERVAERFARPTNEQLKARLLMAVAFQRAFSRSLKVLGDHQTLRLFNWYKQVYCFLMDLQNKGRTTDRIIRLLRDTPEPQLILRFSCEWLFDEGCWRTLPEELQAILKS